MKKFISLALCLALMVGCMAGCGSKSSDTSATSASPAASASATAIKIGGTGPLSGAAAIYGTAAKNGAKIAVDEINAMGESIQFDLKYEDDEHEYLVWKWRPVEAGAAERPVGAGAAERPVAAAGE